MYVCELYIDLTLTLKGIQRKNQISNIKRYYGKTDVILSDKTLGFSIELITRITSDLSETNRSYHNHFLNYVHILFLN